MTTSSDSQTSLEVVTSIGFIGTRHGLSEDQKGMLQILLCPLRPREVHHGDGLGSDAEFHQMIRELLPNTKIVTHPPQDSTHRAFCEGDEEHIERPYLTRNRDIVRASELLITAPAESSRELRSGTWNTWLFARRVGVATWLILPDGRTILGPIPAENPTPTEVKG